MPEALSVGVPRETKPGEHRVAVTPDGVRELTAHKVTVIVESGAGADSGIPDDDYRAAGADVVARADQVWERVGVVCKVKEPQPAEFALLRPGLVLFAYLHLAGYPDVARELLAREVTGVAYETVQLGDRSLPLLTPMSEIAGRLAPQVGARFLERTSGGRGVLLGGVAGVAPARVVVLGAGTVGCAAARIAVGMQATVTVLNRSLDRLRAVDELDRGRLVTVALTRAAVARAVAEADLLIGAVLVPGGRAPQIVPEELVAEMQPGSVIVDVAVDQGGCVATTRETSHDDPVYDDYGVVHYAVGNMPAAVPRTSTYALTNATLPYLIALAAGGVRNALNELPELRPGLNTYAGSIANAAVGAALGEPVRSPDTLIG